MTKPKDDKWQDAPAQDTAQAAGIEQEAQAKAQEPPAQQPPAQAAVGAAVGLNTQQLQDVDQKLAAASTIIERARVGGLGGKLREFFDDFRRPTGVRRQPTAAEIEVLTLKLVPVDPPPPPKALNVIRNAGGATALAGSVLVPSVQVVDDNNNGVPGVPVRFAVGTGLGRVENEVVASDRSGVAAVEWRLGARGPNRLTAIVGHSAVTITATAT